MKPKVEVLVRLWTVWRSGERFTDLVKRRSVWYLRGRKMLLVLSSGYPSSPSLKHRASVIHNQTQSRFLPRCWDPHFPQPETNPDHKPKTTSYPPTGLKLATTVSQRHLVDL